MTGHERVFHGTHHTADKPVQRQAGRHGKADPQAHQGHHPHHHLVLLCGLGILCGFCILHAVFIGDDGIVGLLGDPHLQHLAAGGHQGDQDSAHQTPVKCAPAPELPLGNGAQVDAQEAKVDAFQRSLGDAGNGSLQLGSVLGDILGSGNLVIVTASCGVEQIGIDGLDGLHDQVCVFNGLAQQVTDGLTDHGKQRNQNQHGHQAPQAAAAAHGCAFFLLQLLDGLILLLLIICVFTLNFLNTGLKTGHLHHALFALCGDGQQNQLHDDRKEDHGHTIVTQQAVKLIQQPAEGNGDQVGEFKCQKHRHTSSLVVMVRGQSKDAC